jgi:hypothetical protein
MCFEIELKVKIYENDKLQQYVFKSMKVCKLEMKKCVF